MSGPGIYREFRRVGAERAPTKCRSPNSLQEREKQWFFCCGKMIHLNKLGALSLGTSPLLPKSTLTSLASLPSYNIPPTSLTSARRLPLRFCSTQPELQTTTTTTTDEPVKPSKALIPRERRIRGSKYFRNSELENAPPTPEVDDPLEEVDANGYMKNGKPFLLRGRIHKLEPFRAGPAPFEWAEGVVPPRGVFMNSDLSKPTGALG